ncbi:MAG: hypothetical protein HYZ62_00555 [Candidatus Andersenbacteria bacterium]|nr:hypothetical protein [Candidatus Andersenbacteria bacterium]
MDTATRLDPKRVETIFMDCLFNEGEDTRTHIRAEGVTTTVGFHPGRLESHRVEIGAMLDELPDGFKASQGGGQSFLQACEDRHGHQWTGFHQRMEQLFQLGIAIGKVKLKVPRQHWHTLPGGMPYYVVAD